jgi:pimeloyl-ACP methyl ester carboxylesterase
MHKRHINFYSFKEYVDTLSDQIDTVSPKPVVIAHSLGGAVLQKYLENHSIPGAVLLSTLPSNGILSMCLRLLQRHPMPILSGILKLNFYEWVKTPVLAQELFLKKDTQIDIVSFQKQLVGESAMVAVQLLFPFAKVNPNKSPMLFISGDKDAVFTRKEEDRTARKYNSKNLIIENQTHDLMMESAWKQVADVIDNWITHELALP